MTSAERALGSNAATEPLLQKTNQFILGLSEHFASNHNDHRPHQTEITEFKKITIKKNVKQSRYRPGVAQRVPGS